MENQRIAEIGIKIVADALSIECVPAFFWSSQHFNHISITAMYLPDQHIIVFNEKWVNTASPEEILLTAIHETCHAFQKLQIDAKSRNENRIPDETVLNWVSDFNHYHQASGEDLTDSKYLDQEIEKDAIAYSSELVIHLMEKI